MLKNRLFGAALLFLVSAIGAFPMAINALLELGWTKSSAVVVMTQVNTKKLKKNFDLVYRFKMNKTSYVKRQSLGESSNEEIEALQKKYQKNATIKVIYDPKDPKSSKVYEEGNIAYICFVIGLPAVLLFAALTFFKKSFELQTSN